MTFLIFGFDAAAAMWFSSARRGVGGLCGVETGLDVVVLNVVKVSVDF